MNFSKILFIIFLSTPLTISFAQKKDISRIDQTLSEDKNTPPPPPIPAKNACKNCDDYWVISDFKEGIRAVKDKTGQIGFTDKKGNLIIPLEYKRYSSIDKNRIIISKEDYKKGMIDFKNKVIIPFEYNSISKSSNDSYIVTKDDRKGVLDHNGEEIIPIEYESIKFNKGYFIVKRNYNTGILDMNGITLIEPKYKSVEEFVHSYFICQSTNNSNIIDVITGQKLLEKKYTELNAPYSNFLIATIDNKMGLINFSEEVIIPFDYNEIKTFHANQYLVKKNDLYGIYDVFQETEVIPVEYDEIYKSGGGFRLKQNGKYGFAYLAQNQLKTILSIEYDEISFMSNGRIKVNKNNKYGLYSSFSKKMIIPLIYDKIKTPSYAYSSFYLVYTGEKINIISGYDFTMLVDKKFDKVDFKYGFLICLQDGKYYLYSPTGHTYQEQLDDLVFLSKNLIKIKKRDKWGVYDTISKDWVIPCEQKELNFDTIRNIVEIGNDTYKMIGNKLIKQ